VQKYSTEALNVDRNALKKRNADSVFSLQSSPDTMKCGGQARSEIPRLKCSEHPGSQQLRKRGSAEGHCI